MWANWAIRPQFSLQPFAGLGFVSEDLVIKIGKHGALSRLRIILNDAACFVKVNIPLFPTSLGSQSGEAMNALYLRRIDLARNMSRFYRLDVQPDLFGGVLLMKAWGRIGTHGRMLAERYDTEGLAAAAMQQQAERKRRRGYAD